jgi:DNA-binding NtrC family response regulator
MKTPVVMLVADQKNYFHRNVKMDLISKGFKVIEADKKEGLVIFKEMNPIIVIIWSSQDGNSQFFEIAYEIRQVSITVPIIFVTSTSSEEMAIAALRAGISDYIKLPCTSKVLFTSIDRCLSQFLSYTSWTKTSSPQKTGLIGGDLMVGRSSAMQESKVYIKKIAPSDCAVLITGETGTGKELSAKLIHQNSGRNQKPFVCLNSASIPDTLLESELFGYEKGAFTGAHYRRDGLLRLAEGGTVLFDEIGDMTPYAQAKILRAIETKEIYPLGGKKKISLNIRIIAATNQDLEGLMKEKKFRQDLFFRINVARINLVPLRERKEDLPLLLKDFLKELNRKYGLEVEGFSTDCLATLFNYDFPGNVRELKNLLESIFVNLPSRFITFMDLPELFRKRLKETENLPKDERTRLLSALFTTNWNKSKAAQDLQWSRKTLYRKMLKYNITKSRTDMGSEDS